MPNWPNHLLDAKRLFLATLSDLDARVASDDSYQILGIAGLVRKLFLDEYPLVDQVNRSYRLKLSFTLLPCLEPEEASESWYSDVLDSLDPALQDTMPAKIVSVKRDAFFGTIIAAAWGQAITIRDVVTFEANVGGAVHPPSPAKEPAHQALNTVRQQLVVNGRSISLHHLRNIGKLVLRALHPLRMRLENEAR